MEKSELKKLDKALDDFWLNMNEEDDMDFALMYFKMKNYLSDLNKDQ
jgi:hypothetical protein